MSNVLGGVDAIGQICPVASDSSGVLELFRRVVSVWSGGVSFVRGIFGPHNRKPYSKTV